MRSAPFEALFLILLVSPLDAARHPDANNIGQRDINHGIYGFPNYFDAAHEREMGEAIDWRIQRSQQVITDSVVLPKVSTLATRLLENSDFSGELSLRITRGIDRNAFAVMGGYLYLDESIVAIAASDDEIAAVLAHEIAHLAAKHGAELLSYRQFLQNRMTSRDSVTAYLLDRAREGEFEADELALQYLRQAGFEPHALATILRKIDPAGDGSDRAAYAAHLAQHRDLEARIKAVEAGCRDSGLKVTPVNLAH